MRFMVYILLTVLLTDVNIYGADVLSRVKRVIGGESIGEGDWPYIAHLEGKIPVKFFFGFPLSYRKHYCGGSLIASRWVMTAAHCFRQQAFPASTSTAKYWHITVGEVDTDHDIYDSAKHMAGQLLGQEDWLHWRIHAEAIFIHPDYDEEQNWLHDIALIKLEEALPVNDDPNLSTIQLPHQSASSWPESQDQCVMNGWGCVTHGGGVEDLASTVVLPIVNNDVCARIYASEFDFTGRLCAGYNLQSKGICKGDSGSALVCRHNDGFADRWVQAGIASFTSASRPGEIPGVFTRVSAYADWIQQTMNDN